MNKELKTAILNLECHCLQKEDCDFIYGTYIPFVEDRKYKKSVNTLKQALNKLNKINEIVNTGASAIEKYLHIESIMKRSD